MIRLDSTRISTVVTCSDCPWWYGFADTKPGGIKVGAAHQRRVHPGDDQAAATLRQRKHRNTPS